MLLLSHTLSISILFTQSIPYRLERYGGPCKWPIACGFCPQIFPSLEEQIAHKIEFHLNISLPYQCSECGLWWKSRSNLLKHMIDKHKKYKIYVCTLCKPVKRV